MMELNGADHQLLASHLAEAANHPSFGSMMALMTAEQDLEAGRSSHELHQTASGSHYMYYNDPYHSAAVFHSHLSGPDHHSHLPGPDHLSYDLAIVAAEAAAQPAAAAVPGACSHSCQVDHGADDHHEKVEEEDQKLHLQGTSAAMMIGGGECCSESEQVLQGAGSMPLYSQTCVEHGKGDSSAGLDMESSGAACRRKVLSESTCVTSATYDATKEKILAHPNYHRLLRAYINCRKVGAPPDVVKKLEELNEEYDNPQLLTILSKGGGGGAAAAVPDPELDHFMETYCHVLHQYEEELSKPFNEAMAFLQKVEMQLNHISNGEYRSSQQGDGELRLTMEDKEQEQEEAEEEEEEEGGSCGEVDYEMDLSMDQQTEDKHIKDQLLRKYRGYISTLKHEFMKKKKKGKLPRDARQRLLDWWNEHYKWPYPSETEKATLAETTGLDQKQINNWFINQRKRHWKPSDQDMRYVMVNGQDPPMQDDKLPPA